MKICFITTSINKKREVESYLGVPLEQIAQEIDEIQGDKSIIALDKLKKALSTNKDKMVIIDDTSIEFKALNGFPGPYAKDFIKTTGFERIEQLLSEFGREIKVITILGLGYYKDGVPHYELFEGRLDGTFEKLLTTSNCNFEAFDNRFLPNGSDKVYSDLTLEEKGRIGHRGLACRKLKDYLISNKLI